MRIWVGAYTLVGGLLVAGCKLPAQSAFDKAVADLPSIEAEAKSVGLALSGDELNPKSPIPASENAGPTLARVGKELSSLFDKNDDWDDVLERAALQSGGGSSEASRRLLAQINPLLDDSVAASKKPHCDFGQDWGVPDPNDISFTEVANCRNIIRALTFRAQIFANRGNFSGALSDLRAAVRISEFLGRQPNYLAGLSNASSQRTITMAMQLMLTKHARNLGLRSQIDALAKERLARPASFLTAVRGEIIFGLAVAKMPVRDAARYLAGDPSQDYEMANQYNDKVYLLSPIGVKESKRQAGYRARIIQFGVELLKATGPNPTNAMVAEEIAKMRAQYDRENDPARTLLLELDTPSTSIAENYVESEARWQTLRGLVAVLNYQTRTGRFPSTMSETGFKGVDPFSGSTLRLASSGHELRVYSIGQDRVDNGGQERVRATGQARILDPGRKPPQRDIVSMYPRREYP